MDQAGSGWVDVAAVADLKEDAMTPVTVGGAPLVLVRDGEVVHALGGKCPHKGAPMEQGTYCRDRSGTPVVVCPWHKAVFSTTGALMEPPALDPLPRHDVRIEAGRVLVAEHPAAPPVAPEVKADESVLVLGAGAAGVAGAAALREFGFAGRITLVSDEPDAPYDRTALSKMVLGAKPEELKIPALRPAEWYEANRVERMTARIRSVDHMARRVTFESGETLSADHLLLALGSVARRPDFPGGDLEAVRVLRSAADARAIVDLAGPDKSVVIIGSGFIAMETAAALRKRGTGVTVVARDEAPMRALLGREIGMRLRSLHEQNGVAYLAPAQVVSVEGADTLSVRLDDGFVLRADFVIAGLGAAPATACLDPALRAEDGGVDVDEAMRVLPGVFAVGDIARVAHKGGRVRIEHWRAAQSQARIAARAILGQEASSLPMPWFWTQQFGQKLEYLGWPPAWEAREPEIYDIDGAVSSFDFLAEVRTKDETFGLIGSKQARRIGREAVNPSLVSE
ncbi:FAD-dependent oxidoreductase [Acidomonas methanolica]|uniref:FAD-dependent oxidoreductase n=1 Tax=Acidomonas methanolica TaxID=437 RepID=UPI002119FA18|nr:FAD-dependent oxidoreductase [Acidomonas methanolica]MCQ9155028.1 FAD-dependent oxidoreductase [Acidomonas methanolica]